MQIIFQSTIALWRRIAPLSNRIAPVSQKFVQVSRRIAPVWQQMLRCGSIVTGFFFNRARDLNPQQRANAAAIGIAFMAILFLNLECQSRPAGADTIKVASYKSPTINPNAKKAEPTKSDANLTPEQLAERTLNKKLQLLEQGMQFLQSVPDYTAQFMKRELVGGEMLDEQTILMKLRHQPFSVYMKWADFDTGREVVYVDGQNDGKLLVHAGGWKAKLPAISLSPDSTLAMQEARYPITQVGLLGLAQAIMEYNRRDLESKNFSDCHELEDQLIGDRPCHCFVIEYKDRNVSKEYRKTITMIDKEWNVPVFIKNFAWPNEDAACGDQDLDEATLVEHYTYTEVKFRSSLTALDFDHANEEYKFRRQ